MIDKKCMFDTDRLNVAPWHLSEVRKLIGQDLAGVVKNLLTEPVTRLLPKGWQGTYTQERAREWIRERDSEGTTLLIFEKSQKQPIGLMILAAIKQDEAFEMRIGYLLAESSWGKGFATELLSGFIDWCRRQGTIRSIAGGVTPDNLASKRVLEKFGFTLVETEGNTSGGDELYQLWL